MGNRFDNPEYQAAFDRYLDVVAKLILKYGKQVLAEAEAEEKQKVEATKVEVAEMKSAEVLPIESAAKLPNITAARPSVRKALQHKQETVRNQTAAREATVHQSSREALG